MIIAFGDEATVCPGVPPEPNGWTMLYLALEKAREADTGAMKFVIISDGLPQQATWRSARPSSFRRRSMRSGRWAGRARRGVYA